MLASILLSILKKKSSASLFRRAQYRIKKTQIPKFIKNELKSESESDSDSDDNELMAKLKDSDSDYDSDLDLETESKSNAKLMTKLKKLHSEKF